MLKIGLGVVLISLPVPALADAIHMPGPKTEPVEYPVCSAKVTDKCIEKRAVAKPKATKAATGKVVRRDKVHRRKG